MRESEAVRIVRGGPTARFRWHRLWDVWTVEHTCTSEALMGAFFFLVRGFALLGFGYSYPGIEYYLRAVGLNEYRLGWLCILLGLLHLYGAATERYRVRAWIAVAGLVLAITVVSAFVVGAPPKYQPIATAWVSIGACEIYFMFRNWLTRDAAKVILSNGSHSAIPLASGPPVDTG